MEHAKDSRALLNRTKALLFVRTTEAVAGFIVLVVLTLSLPPAELGYWFLIMGMVGTSQTILEIRTTEAIFSYLPRLISTQAISPARYVYRNCLGAGVMGGMLSSLLLVVMINLFSDTYFDRPLTVECIVSAMLICGFRAVNQPMFATIRAVGTTRQILIFGGAVHALRCTVVAVTVLNFPGFENLIFASACAEISVALIFLKATSFLFWGRCSLEDKEKIPPRKEMLRFLGFSSLIGLLNASVLQADILLLGLFVPATTVATYGLARRVASISDIFLFPLNEAVFARLAAANNEYARKEILFVEKRRALFLTAIIISGMLMVAPLLNTVLAERHPGIGVAFAMIAFWNIWFSGHWFRPLLATLGRQREAAAFITISVISFAISAPILTMAFGLTGLIVSHYVRILVWLIAGGLETRRCLHTLRLP